MIKMVAIPGFLGSITDYEFLGEGNVEVINPSAFLDEKFEEQIPASEYLVGYSMGARVAASLKVRYPNKFKKLVLLGGHLGLSAEEKKGRKEWEDEVLEKMNSDDFLTYWDSLEVFKNDTNLDLVIDSEVQKKIFYKFRLSEQENYLNLLIQMNAEVHYLVGERDQKYMSYVQEYIKPHFKTTIFPSAGHRLLKSEAVQSYLKGLL